VRGLQSRDVAEEGAHGGQACIAGADAVVTLVLKMIEERADQRDIDFAE
jgi:uncharacterized protein (DUF433 family)